MDFNLLPTADMFLLPYKFKTLLSDNQSRTSIQNKIKSHLEIIEHDLATKENRVQSEIDLQIDASSPINMQIIDNDGSTSLQRNPSFHIDELNKHVLNCDTHQSGIYILASLYHEAEHAAQWNGKSYDTHHRRMCNISKALYNTNEPVDYRNNYVEVKARISEANFYIAAYNRIVQIHPSYATSDEFLLIFKHARRELTYLTSENAMRTLNERNIATLKRNKDLPERLKYAFPMSPLTKHKKAAHFLQKHGMCLYKEILDEMQQTTQSMDEIIAEIEAKRREDKTQTQKLLEQQDKQNMIQIAKQYTVINTIVQPQPHLMFAVKNCEQLQQQLVKCKDFYNVAIYTTQDDEMCIIADVTPIPRPYSTDNELKKQWYTLHSNVYNPEMHDEIQENQHEELDDIEEH